MLCLACCRDAIEVPAFFFLVQLLDQWHCLIYTSHQQTVRDMSTSLAIVRMPGPFAGHRHYSTYAMLSLMKARRGRCLVSCAGEALHVQELFLHVWVLADWVPKSCFGYWGTWNLKER